MILLLGGLAFLLASRPWVAPRVVVLLIVVVPSYRQLIKAYPSGGGDYEVARKNLGEKAGAGRRGRAARRLRPDRRRVGRLRRRQHHLGAPRAEPVPCRDRGRIRRAARRGQPARRARVEQGVRDPDLPLHRQRSRSWSSPRWSAPRSATPPVAESADLEVQGESLAQAAFVLLLLRSFASGCAALTGVEAISNGVPAFRRPKIKNAQKTLVAMGAIAIVLFSGLVAVALIAGVHYVDCTDDVFAVRRRRAPTATRSAASSPRSRRPPSATTRSSFFIIQAATAAVLLLAANTAFNGFPLLGSVLATRPLRAQVARHPRRPPHLLERRASRSRSSAVILLIVFQAERDRAHPAVHHRRLRLVHARPDRHGAALDPAAARRHATTAARDLARPVDQRPRRRDDGDAC